MAQADSPSRARTDELGGYIKAMESAPALGYLVVYSVFDGRVTHGTLDLWFIELGLDKALLPPEPRPVDAFEKVTGELKVTYPVDDPGAKPGRRKREGGGEVATLMVRHVARDGERVVRQLVREVRDEGEVRLSYNTHLAEVVFERDASEGSGPGAGALAIRPDWAVIAGLAEAEGRRVMQVLEALRDAYRHRCTYLSGDKLRSVVRRYVEDLSAVRVRPTGGVYFVGRDHGGALGALHELVGRFGAGSNLARIPLPDNDEMREMIISAWRERAKGELEALSREIARARQDRPSEATIERLYREFRKLKAVADEHSGVLDEALEETNAAMELAGLQIRSLLTEAGGE
jgi:hypothetical protein